MEIMLHNLETALAGGLGQMSLVNWLPTVSTQSRVFISGNEIQGMVTYIPVGGGAGEMAVCFTCCVQHLRHSLWLGPNPLASAVSRF